MKKLVIVALICLSFVVIAIMAVGGWAALHIVLPKLMRMSANTSLPQLPPPGVIQGQGVLTRQSIIQDARLNRVTCIVAVNPKDPRNAGLLVVGCDGAKFLDSALQETKFVSFDGANCHVDALPVEGGAFEFLRRGSWGDSAAVLAADGKEKWHYASSWGIDDMAPCGAAGPGKLAFVVGLNGGGGVVGLDGEGRTLWNQSGGNVWHVEVFDADHSGRPVIVHSDASGRIWVRGFDGTLIRKSASPSYFAHFSVCRWPDAKSPENLLLADNGAIFVVDATGKTIASLTAPNCINLATARGVPVSLVAGQPPYFAVLVSMHRGSVLYVYSSDRTLVYHESLGEGGEALYARPGPDGAAETLLVAGDGKIWEYAMTKPAEKQ